MLSSKYYIKKRIENLCRQMQEQRIETVIIAKPQNIMYFSNFNPVLNSHPAYVLVKANGDSCLLVHSLRLNHAQEEACLDNIQSYGKWGRTIPVAMEPIEAITRILGTVSGEIGLEADFVNVAVYKAVEDYLHPKSIVSVSNLINNMKLVKDESEIAAIRKASVLVDEGLTIAIECLRNGYSEAQASTEGQYAMRKMWQKKYPDSEVCGYGTSEGGVVDSLNVWCLSNGRIAYGCDCPRAYYPQDGDLTLPIAWAKVDGYHGELERTILVGDVTGIRARAYAAMLEAREAVFTVLRPEVQLRELYEAATKVYVEHGFGDILPGRVGHGIGCSAHEFPSITGDNTMLLKSGMVISVEPGIMDITWGGVRHSDTVLITSQGYEVLTTYHHGRLEIKK